MITGAGYGSADFGAWGGSANVLLLMCMFIGGYAGSTTCRIKVFRFQVLAANAAFSYRLCLYAVVIAYYNKRAILKP